MWGGEKEKVVVRGQKRNAEKRRGWDERWVGMWGGEKEKVVVRWAEEECREEARVGG